MDPELRRALDEFDATPVEKRGRGGRGSMRGLRRYWRAVFGGGGGRAGDFYDCVNTLGSKPGIKDPKRLCAWWHHQETGAWPGHAANEKKAVEGGVVEETGA